MSQLIPFPHQQQSIENLNKQFKQNNNKALIVLPSGSGKTHIVAFHVNKLKPKSLLFIVHRNEISNQTLKIFKEVCNLKESQIGIIDAHHKQFDKQFIFSTVQTLHRNLDKIPPYIEYMIIDEYHHAAADTYKSITNHFKPKYFVGLTATPFRLDNKDLLDFVNNNIVINMDLFKGIEQKIIVPFHYIGLYDDIDYSEIRYGNFQYNVTDLDRALIIHKRDEAVIREYKDKLQDRITIAFCNSVKHVERITEKFRNAGVKAIGITHKESFEQRQDKLENFKKGYYKVLFTRDILNEGVDFPQCSAVMFLRPTISKTIFLQQLGRGLRKHPNKQDVLVLDFIGNYIRAFEKRDEWFLASGTKQYTGKYIKPVYEYDYPKPVVEFEQRVIDMMDIQARAAKQDYRNVDLGLYIQRLQEKLGRKYITLTDWRKHYGKLATSDIKNYGGFDKFREKYNIPNFIEKICQQCGKKFQTKYSKTKYIVCSNICRDRLIWSNNRRPKIKSEQEKKLKIIEKCPECGKDFHPYKLVKFTHKNEMTQVKRGRYCSRACEGRSKYRKSERIKIYPDKITKPIKFVMTNEEKEQLEKDIISIVTKPILVEDIIKELKNNLNKKLIQYYLRKLIKEGRINKNNIIYLNKRGNPKQVITE